MGAHDLPLGGWRLRDATLPAFRFPRGALVPASETLTFFVGRRPRWDRNHRTHFYWWQTRFRFANVPRPNRRGAGGGAYLLDRQGDLRAWMVYPCRYRCTDGRRGKLALRIRPTDRELIELRNTSARRISLAETVFERSPWIYRFRQSMTLAAGQTLRLFTAGSPRRDTHLVKHWGTRGFFLPDSGGSIRLRTHTNIAIVCRAWGSARC